MTPFLTVLIDKTQTRWLNHLHILSEIWEFLDQRHFWMFYLIEVINVLKWIFPITCDYDVQKNKLNRVSGFRYHILLPDTCSLNWSAITGTQFICAGFWFTEWFRTNQLYHAWFKLCADLSKDGQSIASLAEVSVIRMKTITHVDVIPKTDA